MATIAIIFGDSEELLVVEVLLKELEETHFEYLRGDLGRLENRSFVAQVTLELSPNLQSVLNL